MGFLKEHWFKMGILVCALLVIIFANNYLQQRNSLATLQSEQQKEDKAKAFTASQKEACLNIYKQESVKWNNTNGWSYNELRDICSIQYKETTPKTQAQCDEQYKGEDGKVIPLFFSDYLLCMDGLFEKTF